MDYAPQHSGGGTDGEVDTTAGGTHEGQRLGGIIPEQARRAASAVLQDNNGGASAVVHEGITFSDTRGSCISRSIGTCN